MAKHESSAQVVVCDAGPLIHLDELGCLDLLDDFAKVLVPSAVWKEVEHHRSTALTRQSVPLQKTITSGPLPADLKAIARLFALHHGEARALQLAQRHDTDLFLTDDSAARLAAKTLRIPVHGTIGVLIRAIRRDRRARQEVIDLLQSIPTSSSLHLKQSLLDDVIREVAEQA